MNLEDIAAALACCAKGDCHLCPCDADETACHQMTAQAAEHLQRLHQTLLSLDESIASAKGAHAAALRSVRDALAGDAEEL